MEKHTMLSKSRGSTNKIDLTQVQWFVVYDAAIPRFGGCLHFLTAFVWLLFWCIRQSISNE